MLSGSQNVYFLNIQSISGAAVADMWGALKKGALIEHILQVVEKR